ncbi:rho GTPase-activating protein 15 isoform X2 [Gallus gallus]|uniref:Rho GTPase-activating protein 15 n=1 Tax=Gallus gallus TaxID=9031 RepID=A0A8V0YA87_CHICK|nr:rho GTPase-activating protein 15 isoform X2 [Gallus gallus]XP_046777461.1 rho GTPase-activating protein 15 isoform X2 [Gallus gallus]|eukprot:XP_025007981.1 rho GTPase-activating protein 15 isoform X2 [Gallus gallus]
MERSTTSDTASEKPNPSHSTGAVQMRIKNANSHHDRLSQSKSMILSDNVKVLEPINRHRRNHSQHNLTLADIISTPDHTVVEKEGYLLKAKIADGGKKLRKNWSTSWIVLTSRKMEFYKESKQPALANLKPGYKPECVDLCGAHIEWTPEKSSRKNVFQPKERSCTSRNLEFKLRRSSSTELLNSLDTESKESKPEHRKSLIFRLNYSASDSNDRSRVKSRLKKFISRRPSLKTLQEKGLIKDQIFGSHLHLVCEHENSTVPQFVRQCIKAVERRGLEVDGIYRVSGNLATIQKLRFVVNQEEKLNLDDSQWEDIHVVTGALKMFFRELPEPLFPYCFFEQFVEAIKIQDNATRIKAVKTLVKKLPRPNYDTMKVLFEHLKKIAAKESVNLMSTQSLGIVFGPTLLRPEKETGNMAVHMLYQNQIVELMLSEYSKIFGSEED